MATKNLLIATSLLAASALLGFVQLTPAASASGPADAGPTTNKLYVDCTLDTTICNSGSCTVNVVNSECSGSCTVNAVGANCQSGGECWVNVGGTCNGTCEVNVNSKCTGGDVKIAIVVRSSSHEPTDVETTASQAPAAADSLDALFDAQLPEDR